MSKTACQKFFSYQKDIVRTALSRSLGAEPDIIESDGCLLVLCGAFSRHCASSFQGKALVFGKPATLLLPVLGLREDNRLPKLAGQDHCPPAEGSAPFTQSPAFLVYGNHPLNAGLAPSIRYRPFTRFDYADEWNNLGFGRIRTDDSVWAACGGLVPDGAVELAGIRLIAPAGSSEYAGSYLTVFDTPSASVLWCARPVGPVDSVEWSVIEHFLSDWRAGEVPCLPCLCQTPAGCRCLVTMRLDCDENIASARGLFEWYAQEEIPFSLAVKTSLTMRPDDMVLLEDVRASGGTLLSHSHTHQPNWGATYEEALRDAETSHRWLAETWPHLLPADLAVSPFHTNPPYAVQAISQAGFTGMVAGIIHNDPEYMLGRAGVVPFTDGNLVSISQQSMLHGDCYRRQGESVKAHIAAFEAQYAAGGIFGYLDHPFSERYQYDWESEEQRLQAHHKLVAALRTYEDVQFWSQKQCFDFVKVLASVRLHVTPDGKVLATSGASSNFGLKYRYMNQEFII